MKAVILAAGKGTRMRELTAEVPKPMLKVEGKPILEHILQGIKQVAAHHGVRIVCFGHAGDGNVHVNVLKDDVPDDRWEKMVPEISEEIYRLTFSLGGQITGEHGVGATRSRYLPMALDRAQLDLMRAIRDTFDPAGILNPGKIFP